MEIIRNKRKAAALEDKEAGKVAALQIERVIGLSAPNSRTVCFCPSKADLLCYPAGSFAVVYSTATRQQLRLLRSTTSNHALKCVSWSTNGEYVAAGEDAVNASVIVWNLDSGECVQDLKAHRQSIASLCFSPDGRLLASVGGPSDGQLCLWDWQAGNLLWKQSIGSMLSSAAFTEDSSHILAVGKGMFKAWSIGAPQQQPGRSKDKCGYSATSNSSSLNLTARPVTLRDLRNSSFVDVCMAPCQPGQPHGSNGIYALVESGVLVLMRPTGRTIDKSVNLQVPAAFALAASPVQVAAACAQGIVRLFACKTLAFCATLPRFVTKGHQQAVGAGSVQGSMFPDAQGCSFAPGCNKHLLVAYADQSIFLWNVEDTQKITCTVSLSAHSGCVWDVCPLTPPMLTVAGQDQPARVATCAADGTIRLWNVAGSGGRLLAGTASVPASDGSVQLRCMRMSPDCRHICIGDLRGNLRVYECVTLKPTIVHEAHDDEVLCLDYSPIGPDSDCLAASGSRDTLIHIYDVQRGYELVETLDDHSAAVTAVRFTGGGRGLVSCGADKSIIFRLLGRGSDAGSAIYHIETLPHTLLYDLALDPLEQYIFTTGQDGLLRQWDVTTGALQRTLTPEAGAGEPTRLCIDPGGLVLICCHSDGCLRLYSLATGQLMWRAWGHADMVASATITPDLTRLVSVGGDGCVIVWRLPEQLVKDIQAAVPGVAAAKVHFMNSKHSGHQDDSTEEPAALQSEPSGSKSASVSPHSCSQPALSPLQQDVKPSNAAAGDVATPPNVMLTADKTSSSDSAVSSTLLRLKQGRPLVSTDKLPKWARSPPLPSSPTSPAAAGGGHKLPGSGWPKAKQQAKGKWGLDEKLTLHNDENQPVTEVHTARLLSLDHTCTLDEADADTTQQTQHHDDGFLQKQQCPEWCQDDDMVVIQDWDSNSLAGYEPRALATAEQAHEEDAERPLGQPETLITNGGGPEVVRDLFKQHFSSLEDDKMAQPMQREHRQSLSAMFKAGRSSLCGSLPFSVHKASSCLDNRLGQPAYGNLSAPALSSELRSAAAEKAPADEGAHAAVSNAMGGCLTADQHTQQAGKTVAGEKLLDQQNGARKRWRHGKMDKELADMRQRLANLHALYQEQVLQRQASPRRSKLASDRTDDTTDELQQQQTQECLDTTDVSCAAVKRSKVEQLEHSASPPAYAGRSNSTKQASTAALHGENPALPPCEVIRQADEGPLASPPPAVGPVFQSPVVGLPQHPASSPAATVLESCSSSCQAAAESQKDEQFASSEEPAAGTCHHPAPTAAAQAAANGSIHNSFTSADESNPDCHAHTAESPKQASYGNQLLAQLLADSPGPSPSAEESIAAPFSSMAAKLAKLRRGVQPRGSDALLNTGLSPASNSKQLSQSGSDSLTPAVGPQQHLLIDNDYRVSIGTSITACDDAASRSGRLAVEEAAKAEATGQGSSQQPSSSPFLSRSISEGVKGEDLSSSLCFSTLTATGADVAGASAAVSSSHSCQECPSTAQEGAAEPHVGVLSEAAVLQGVAVTPHGQHTVWPGWGSSDCWTGLTPSPSQGSVAHTDVPQAATSQAPPAADADAKYWLQQNPCFDMTPTGSTPGTAYPSQNGTVPFDVSTWVDGNNTSTAAVREQPSTSGSLAPASSKDTELQPGQSDKRGCTSGSAGTEQQGNDSIAADSHAPSCGLQPGNKQGDEDPHHNNVEEQQTEPDALVAAMVSSPGGNMPEDNLETPPGSLQDTSRAPVKDAPEHTEQKDHTAQHQSVSQQPHSQHAGSEPLSGSSIVVVPPAHQSAMSPAYSGVSEMRRNSDTMLLGSPSSSKGKDKAQSKREKAAARAAAKAATALQRSSSDAGVISPGSSMLSLLQRIKRTMPGMRRRASCSEQSSTPSTISSPQRDALDNSPFAPHQQASSIAGQGAEAEAVTAEAHGDCLTSHNRKHIADGVATLASWACALDVQQEEHQQRTLCAENETAGHHSTGVSVNEVKLELEDTQKPPAAELQHGGTSTPSRKYHTPEQSTDVAASHAQYVPAGRLLADKHDTAEVDAVGRTECLSAAKRCTATQFAESIGRFKQSVQEMQQLWLQLQSLSLDSHDATELLPLLTPPASSTAATGQGTGPLSSCESSLPAEQPGSTSLQTTPASVETALTAAASAASGDSNSCDLHNEPVVLVKQRLQDELLSSIWKLHATVTGLSSDELNTGSPSPAGCGLYSPMRMHSQPCQLQSLHSQQQASSSTGAIEGDTVGTPPSTKHLQQKDRGSDAAASPCSPAWSLLSQGGPSKDVLEEVTSRICEQYTDILIKKLEKTRLHSSPAKGRPIRMHRQSQQQK